MQAAAWRAVCHECGLGRWRAVREDSLWHADWVWVWLRTAKLAVRVQSVTESLHREPGRAPPREAPPAHRRPKAFQPRLSQRGPWRYFVVKRRGRSAKTRNECQPRHRVAIWRSGSHRSSSAASPSCGPSHAAKSPRTETWRRHWAPARGRWARRCDATHWRRAQVRSSSERPCNPCAVQSR